MIDVGARNIKLFFEKNRCNPLHFIFGKQFVHIATKAYHGRETDIRFGYIQA